MATRKEEKFLRSLHEKIFKTQTVRSLLQDRTAYADNEHGQRMQDADKERCRSLCEQQKLLEEVILEYVEAD